MSCLTGAQASKKGEYFVVVVVVLLDSCLYIQTMW